MRVEINKETFMDCVKGFKEGEVPILHGFGSFYYVKELHHNQEEEKDRFYVDVELVKTKTK